MNQGTDTASIRVVTTVRNVLVQLGLETVIAQVEGLVLAASANEPTAITDAIRKHRPGIVITDPEFAIRALRDIHRLRRNVRLVLVSLREHFSVRDGIEPGAVCGFLGCNAFLDQIVALLGQTARCVGTTTLNARCADCPGRVTLLPPKLPLSSREAQVFEMIGTGKGTTDIAEALNLSVKTVEYYRQTIKRKLHLENGWELNEAAILWRNGLSLPAHRLAENGRRAKRR